VTEPTQPVKRWRVAITESQVVSVSLKQLVKVEKACKARPDIVAFSPLTLDGGEWRVFKGEGEPPQELMELAYSGRR